jgi:hypothetical protein
MLNVIICNFREGHFVAIFFKSQKIGGFFKVNCGAMDGDLSRLKKRLEAQ